MKSSRTLVSVCGLFAATLPFGAVATAQDSAIPSVPSESTMNALNQSTTPPILEYLIESGVKLTYLGDAGGLESYLGESPSGKTQVFYLTPDNRHVVAGFLFKDNGVNVTGVQLTDMKNRYEDARRKAEAAASGLEQGSTESVPEPELTDDLQEITPDQVASGAAEVPSADEYLSRMNPDALSRDLENISWFRVGANDAPIVYMVADPNCPFCHRMWKDLRPMVMSREISLRIILIAGLEGSEADATSLLSREDPAKAWFQGEGSTRTMPVTAPPPAGSEEFKTAQSYLRTNMDFVADYDVSATPFLFYFDENGTVLESSGIPEDQSVFFSRLPEE